MDDHITKILLVEDDEDDYIITCSLIAAVEGYKLQLDWVTTYDAAIEAIAHKQHHVYLVDYRLGHRNGIELLHEAIARGCEAPIILLTGQGDHDTDTAAIKAGAADYLVKGQIDATLLERSIRHAVEREYTLKKLRQALEEKSQLAIAINSLSTGVAITDPNQPDNPIIFINPGFTAMTGYEWEDVVGVNCRFLQGPETEPETVRMIQEAIATKTPITTVLLNYRKDGTPFWNELTINPVFDSNGDLINFVGLQTDVTSRKQAEVSLGQLRRQNELILNSAGEGIYGLDLAGKATFVNPAAARMTGWSVKDLIGKLIPGVLHSSSISQAIYFSPENLIPENSGPLVSEMGWSYQQGEEVFWRKDGTSFLAAYISNPIREDGKLVGTVVTFQDITERKLAEEALRESEERYALAVRGANDGLWDWNLKTNQVYYSPRWKSMLGYSDREISSNLEEWFERIHPEDLEWVKGQIFAHLEGLSSHFENEHRILHCNGTYRWVLNRGLAVRDIDGRVSRMAGSQTDITARKQTEKKLLHDALYDALTNLPNRALFTDRLTHAAECKKRDKDYLFAVLFLDFDRFKVVNDSLGHMIGNQLLVAIAHRLTTCLRPGDTIARLGGDEFVILLENMKDASDATLIADRIQKELIEPFDLSGHEVFSTASIGIALSTTEYNQPEDLLRDADIAMYRAKALGKARYEIFNSNMHLRAMSLLHLETDLRHAIEREEFRIHYQPIVSLRSGRIAGFEALARWYHPQRGLISPAEFIPVAEETGLIIPIGFWVLREACRQMRSWQIQFPRNLSLIISVNLSGRQFSQPNLVEQINQILLETQLDPHCLKLEITESVVMGNAESAIALLAQLKKLGIHLSIDDFGTGYSSLSYLHRFPIDTLKIDRSFINRIDTDGEQLEIVRTIVTLAWNLGLDVIAEGVETAKQLAQLKSLQCEYGQGYFFSRPLDSEPAGLLVATDSAWLEHKTAG